MRLESKTNTLTTSTSTTSTSTNSFTHKAKKQSKLSGDGTQVVGVHLVSEQRLLIVSNNCTLTLWNANTFAKLQTFHATNHTLFRYCMANAILPNNQIAIGSGDSGVNESKIQRSSQTHLTIFNLANGVLVKTVPFKITPNVLVNLDNDWQLVGGDLNGTIVVFDVNQGNEFSDEILENVCWFIKCIFDKYKNIL